MANDLHTTDTCFGHSQQFIESTKVASPYKIWVVKFLYIIHVYIFSVYVVESFICFIYFFNLILAQRTNIYFDADADSYLL